MEEKIKITITAQISRSISKEKAQSQVFKNKEKGNSGRGLLSISERIASLIAFAIVFLWKVLLVLYAMLL